MLAISLNYNYYFVCASYFNLRVLALGMETHVFDSCIRGHRVSKVLDASNQWGIGVCWGKWKSTWSLRSGDKVSDKERKLGCWPRAQPFVRCSYVLEIIIHVTKTTRVHYYWWIKYWRFLLQIANRQSLLLVNISSCTVVYYKNHLRSYS